MSRYKNKVTESYYKPKKKPISENEQRAIDVMVSTSDTYNFEFNGTSYVAIPKEKQDGR